MTKAQVTAVAMGYRMDRRAQAARGAFGSFLRGGEKFRALDAEICRCLGHRGPGMDEAMAVVDAMDEVTFRRLTAQVPEAWWD